MISTRRKEVATITTINHHAIRRIHRLRLTEERERTGLYYIEGFRFVSEAIAHAARIDTLVVSRPLLAHPYAERLISKQQRLGTPILWVAPHVLQSVSLADDPQGIGAIVRQRWEPLSTIKPANDLCWIVHHTVRSSGNLGTILRTSEAVGGAGLILLDKETDPYAPSTVRATMGALFAQRFVRASVDEFVRWKQEHHCMLVGTSPSAKQDYHTMRYQQPTLLFMGEERKGLPPELQRLCDVVVQIPMVGRSDSLNLAIATSVMLYEVFNQHRAQVG